VTGTSVFDAWQAERAHLGELPLLPEPLRLGRDSTRDGGLSRVLRGPALLGALPPARPRGRGARLRGAAARSTTRQRW